ncbi:large subunit ribosomal protein, mitochondrial precursor, putative [Candida dubliniensis CD36]|uniref:Large ribosomal subunit protein mL60 n=1 Tax=Candida dubliniensis (strain CD36 / ATCC MYA-646 / CBS 7987 / NCPF 3949 / NRRL Y-17841) TaxID=573826 RepID=B9WAM0_CANDC|nr:mitochondrial 54S ribosomal protein YmL31 [Candida dubliniensis CD36]CAX43440.1 large subunit ribosomal protein, mitochondrial precursor, putative [Candida dubliniensis CD36]
MFSSLIRSGGYIWKFTSRLTSTQKYKLRNRMKQVDENINNIYQGLIKIQENKSIGDLTNFKKIDYLKFQFPKENEMTTRDKYTTFNRHSKNYRKPIHRVPKWTKLSFRENPKYF